MTLLLCAAPQCRLRGRHTTACYNQQCPGCQPARTQDGLNLCTHHTGTIGPDASEAAQLWTELGQHLTGGSTNHSEIRTQTAQPGLTINDTITEHRHTIRNTLVSWTRLISEDRGITLPWKNGPWELIKLGPGVHGPLNRRRTRTVDHNTTTLGRFIATHATWLAAQPFAGDASDELHTLVTRGRALRQPSTTRVVHIGQCPNPECAGELRAHMRPTDALLPSAVTCTTNPDHTWDSTQWTKLGRAINGSKAA